MSQGQPFDPLFPAGFVPGQTPPGGGGGPEEAKARIFWTKSRTFNVGPLAGDQAIMTLPASASIDVFVSYIQPNSQPTFRSPDGRELYKLRANEELVSGQIEQFTPGGHVPGGPGNTLPAVGRIFAIRDLPTQSWDLLVNTDDMTPDPDAAPTLYMRVTCIGWSREPTGIGPNELETILAGETKTDRLLSFIAMGGFDAITVPMAGLVQVFNQTVPWQPDDLDDPDLAGASNVIICAIGPSGITPLQANASGELLAFPDQNHDFSNFTTALAGSLVAVQTTSYPTGVSGRIDATAPTGTYYVQIWALAAVPANGTAVTPGNGAIAAPIRIDHSLNANDYFDFEIPGGLQSGAGLVVTLSTTEFTKSASPGNYMSATGTWKVR